MINFVDITKAVESILKAANTEAKEYTIKRNAVVNSDPNVAIDGWIGIYRDGVSYEPYTTGNQPFLADPRIRIEVQAASSSSEEDCEVKLDELVNFVMAAIDGDRNLAGTVGNIKGYQIDYDDNYASGDMVEVYFQTAEILATYEVRA